MCLNRKYHINNMCCFLISKILIQVLTWDLAKGELVWNEGRKDGAEMSLEMYFLLLFLLT